MRQRRIERLLQRAEAALDADCTDGTQSLLEEIEQLDPQVTGIAELRARLADATPPARPAAFREFDEFETPTPGLIVAPNKRKYASLTACLLLIGTVGLVVGSHKFDQTLQSRPLLTPAGLPPVRVDVQEVLPTEAVGTADDQAAPVNAEPQPLEDAAPPRSTDEPPVTEAIPPPTRMAALSPDPEPAPSIPTPAIVPADAVVAATLGPTEEAPPVVPSVATTPLDRPEPVTLPYVSTPLPNTAGTLPIDTPVPASRSTVPDDVGVRTTLARFQSAYSRLDVDAAGAVWPALDRRALARAFDGLAAQRVDLGACDVRVVGETALAECTGSATWTPKVGGGSHSQKRRWEFRLRNGASSWQIVSASVK